MMSQVIGNLIAALVIGNTSQSTYYLIMSAFSIVGALSFLFLKKPIKTDEDI